MRRSLRDLGLVLVAILAAGLSIAALYTCLCACQPPHVLSLDELSRYGICLLNNTPCFLGVFQRDVDLLSKRGLTVYWAVAKELCRAGFCEVVRSPGLRLTWLAYFMSLELYGNPSADWRACLMLGDDKPLCVGDVWWDLSYVEKFGGDCEDIAAAVTAGLYLLNLTDFVFVAWFSSPGHALVLARVGEGLVVIDSDETLRINNIGLYLKFRGGTLIPVLELRPVVKQHLLDRDEVRIVAVDETTGAECVLFSGWQCFLKHLRYYNTTPAGIRQALLDSLRRHGVPLERVRGWEICSFEKRKCVEVKTLDEAVEVISRLLLHAAG